MFKIRFDISKLQKNVNEHFKEKKWILNKMRSWLTDQNINESLLLPNLALKIKILVKPKQT